MKVYIVRHGDKESGEYFNTVLNHQDPPLSNDGIRKAKKLVDYFEEKFIKKIIVSEYIRTQETAKFLANKKKLPVLKDKRLNEIDNGIIETMCDDEIKKNYPEFFKDFFSYSKDVRFPNGENSEEVRIRQKSLLDELIERNEDVVLISHEGYIRLLICHLINLPLYKRNLFHVDLCGISEFEYKQNNNSWKVIRINEVLV